jgi:HEPN domain-containing protein
MPDYEEWLRQAEYDIQTAEAMLQAERYIYTVFMCHLAIEKMFKALYTKRLNKIPPKTHELVYFIKKLSLNLPEDIAEFIGTLSEAHIVTRYPDELSKVLQYFPKDKTEEILSKSKEVVQWIKGML